MIPLFTAFIIKHFICDFLLQWAYQYKNKGTYGHFGGITHAAIHAVGTLIICALFQLPMWIPFVDAIIHYHIDWAKMRINAHYEWTPTNNEYFWWLLGLDQMLHYLTYVGIIWLSA